MDKKMIDKQLTRELMELMINVRAIQLWFHSAHLVSKGVGFEGDHEIYSEIYEAAEAAFDAYAERAIGLSGQERVASPKHLARGVYEKLRFWPEIADSDSLSIAVGAFNIAKNHIQKITVTYKQLKSSGELTLGLDDLLMSDASDWETIVYKLQQRIKVELD
jgi:hypothetical protein